MVGSTRKGSSTEESKNTNNIWVMSLSKEGGHPSSVDSSCHVEQRDMLNHVPWEHWSGGRKADAEGEVGEALAGSHSWGDGAWCWEVSKKEQWQSNLQDMDPETRAPRVYHVLTLAIAWL